MEYKITKPVRLIELFGGYGSQHLAFKYLDINFEHWKLCEWAVKSIQAYKDMHYKDDNTDYSKDLTKDEVINYLFKKGISANYNDPMTYAQVKRLGEKKQRIIYNNIQATKNFVNIQQVTGQDLKIVDTDKYDYLMTYSFPCQSVSVAGKQEGMDKGSSTRSGLLWEVERLLNECTELPQILLMENVTQVHNKKNKANFDKWCDFLSSKGYSNFWKDLNAKNFGVPQNRNRTFMVSILGDYIYEFPKEIELKIRLKDILEEEVDEKYYIDNERVKDLISRVKDNKLGNLPNGKTTQITHALSNREHRASGWKDIAPTLCARDYKDPNVVSVPNDINPIRLGGMFDDEKGKHQAGSIWDKEGLSPTLDTMQGGYRQPCIAVREATKKGYAIAEEGDSINISQPNSKTRRGRVGKQVANTLLTGAEQCVLEPQPCAIRGRACEYKTHTEQTLEINKQTDAANCLTTVQKDSMVLEPKKEFGRMGQQAVETFNTNDPNFGNIINPFNKVLTKDNLSPTITTRPDGFKTAIIPVTPDFRIRKLIPLECSRLMAVRDEDYKNIAENQSNSSLYHLFGDSIVTTPLMAIIWQFYKITPEEEKPTQVAFFDDI